MKRKVFSIALALIMSINLLSMTALAVDANGDGYELDVQLPDNCYSVPITEYYLKDGEVTVPDGVTYIQPFYFSENETITGVKLPNSLVLIDTAAFFMCTNLKSVIIPSSVVYIDDGVFQLSDDENIPGLTIYGEPGSYAEQYAAKCGIPFKPLSDAATPVSLKKATPTTSKVLVNGVAVSFDAYNINGNNYFKLRDVAQTLRGTEKQFEVTWNGEANAITLIPGSAYTSVGGEMEKGDGEPKTALSTTSAIYLNGEQIALTAYNINGNNYFKLRDIGTAFDFDVSWDGANNTIIVDTSKSYTDD